MIIIVIVIIIIVIIVIIIIIMIISSFIILVHSCTHTHIYIYIYISLFLLPYYLYHSALQNMNAKKKRHVFVLKNEMFFFLVADPKFRWVSLLQNGKPCWLNPIGCWSIGGSLPSREPWVSLKPWLSGLGLDDGAVTKTPGHYLNRPKKKRPVVLNLLLGISTMAKCWRRSFRFIFSNGISKISKDFNENFLRFDLYGTGYFVLKKRMEWNR